MQTNVNFLVAGLIFLLLILYHVSTQRRLSHSGHGIFFFCMGVGIADILLDLVTAILIDFRIPALRGLLELLLVLLYLLQVLFPYILFFYTETLRQVDGRTPAKFQVLPMLPACVLWLLVLSNHWTGLLFQVAETGLYLRGPLYLVTYCAALFYVALIGVRSLIHYRQLGKRNFLVIWQFLLITGVCVAIQAARNDFLMTGFGLSLGITLLFLTINNPYDHTDSLTGALDAQRFRELAQNRIDRKKPFHLLGLKLYQLEHINNAMGMATGNQLLVETERILREANPYGPVFRTGGNQFFTMVFSLDKYEQVCSQIRDAYEAPLSLGGEKVEFPAVICGIRDGESYRKSDVLLTYADHLFSSVPKTAETVLIQGNEETLKGFRYAQEVERFLNVALKEDLFQVYYQPVYSTETGGCVSLEALSRLYHPHLGFVPPEVFIGIAEKNDQIAKISLLQFRRICRFLQEHPEAMELVQNVKCNLSPAELLKPGHCRKLVDTMKEHGLHPSFFQFEVTETVATRYSDSLYQAAEIFMEDGVGLCLDDFGSGYANLNTVLQLPFSVVKLDKSLLSGICDTPKVALFYRGIVAAMEALGYRVVAEGVETREELDLVTRLGVAMIQGYYFSKPLSGEEILKLLRSQNKEDQ
ncbi:MAG: EAL domain-containing protein [Bacillota bacterium]|nr:EAL domain-containing protein [Bacillota bacterium]